MGGCGKGVGGQDWAGGGGGWNPVASRRWKCPNCRAYNNGKQAVCKRCSDVPAAEAERVSGAQREERPERPKGPAERPTPAANEELRAKCEAAESLGPDGAALLVRYTKQLEEIEAAEEVVMEVEDIGKSFRAA